jgi:DNA-directed RNA polymerase sigma subunit (sigma70/sigma32)
MRATMQARHLKVLELRAERHSYEEIARMFNVSVERIMQVEEEAMRLLEREIER